MVKLDEKWKKNGRANPRKDEKEPKHPRDPLQRAKLGLAVFPCQKNDSEFVVGVFIGEESVKIRPKSSVLPPGGLSVPPCSLPLPAATARRQSPPPDGLSVPLGGTSTLQNSTFLLFSWVNDLYLQLHSYFSQISYKTMQNKHKIAKNNFWLSLDSFI